MRHIITDTVRQTKSEKFNFLSVSKAEVYSALYDLQMAAQRINWIKKRLFYEDGPPGVHGRDRQGVWPMRDVTHGILGILDEAGELAEVLREYLEDPFGYTDSRLHNNLIEEIGDTLWFCECAMQGMALDLEAAEMANSRKLEARYPEGFNTFHALNRDRENEEEALRPGPPMSDD